MMAELSLESVECDDVLDKAAILQQIEASRVRHVLP